MFLRLCSPKSSKVKSSRSPIWSRTVPDTQRSEEHTSELQSRFELVCRLLLEKKNRLGPGHPGVVLLPVEGGRELGGPGGLHAGAEAPRPIATAQAHPLRAQDPTHHAQEIAGG